MPRGKGQKNERDLARRLSLWLTGGADDDTMWRTGGSGGMRRKTTVHHGDLLSTKPASAPFFNTFCLETKHLKELELEGALRGRKSSAFLAAWRQARDAANRAEREPLLIMRPNFQDHLIAWVYKVDDTGPAGMFCNSSGHVHPKLSKDRVLARVQIVLDYDLVCLAMLDDFLQAARCESGSVRVTLIKA